MAEDHHELARIAVAGLIREGYRAGVDPRWSIRYGFDHDDADQEGRIEEIADAIETGRVDGPDWALALADATGGDVGPSMALDAAREASADEAWLQFDFGDDAVGDGDGWERTTPGDQWTRTAYLESDEANVDEASASVRFSIAFVPGSSRIASVSASDDGGNGFGSIDLLEPTP